MKWPQYAHLRPVISMSTGGKVLNALHGEMFFGVMPAEVLGEVEKRIAHRCPADPRPSM